MFYKSQSEEKQQQYKEILTLFGKLTRLFSDNNAPYLPYRVQENVFCKNFGAENISRSDHSVDAKIGNIGIGLKTWIGTNDQKVAEFDALREKLNSLTDLKLAKTVSKFRNERIRITKNLYGIDKLIYHIVKRIPNTMLIFEHVFEPIDIKNITLLPNRGKKNNIYFTDNRHTYHYSLSKNTLYMLFDNMVPLDSFTVDIPEDPYSYLFELANKMSQLLPSTQNIDKDFERKACLRLYSSRGTQNNFVAQKSGLNQWNAGGRKRKPNEVYIPFPAEDRTRYSGFFPKRGQQFTLILPDGKIVKAKVCQQDGKAIMSNPNTELGEWLLRKVFELPEKTLLTYEMLEEYGIDSVIFTKKSDTTYTIDFAELGTYDSFVEQMN